MKQNDSFVKYLTQAYNELTTHPEAMSDVTAMFEFRAILIPKESDGYPDRDRRDGHEHLPPRPAEAADQACQLPLMRADRLHAERICGRREEGPRAHQQAGMHAVSLDTKKALNSLPRAEVVRALNEAGVPKVLIDYIRNFLDLRHSKDVKCEVCGVPQGDPLSMFLFCMAIERLLRRLEERGITFLAYADDIVAFHDEAYPAGAIVQQAMGLAIRSNKCKSTMAGEEVTFLNHPVSPTPASLAPKAIAGAETALRKIERAPITIHQKLILMSLCVVPMVNHAPLAEVTSDKADYEKFDRRVAQGISTNQQKLRSPGRLPGVPEGEGRPGPAHAGALPRRAAEGMGLPGRQQGDQRPGGAVGGRPGTAGEGAYFNRLLTHTLASGQSGDVLSADVRRADRGGKGPEGEGRLDRGAERGTCPGCHTARTLDHDMNCPKTAWTRTARHDMIVTCLYLRVSGKFNAELEIKTHSHLSDQNQKPDIWLVDKCKAIDVGVIQPRQMDAYYNEKVKKYRDGTLPIIYGTDGSLHPKSKKHLEELHVDLRSGCLRHRLHDCKGERAPDEADQTRPGRKPGHPERPPPVILLLTTE
ncbi:Hypothetical protein DHA2_154256 [Giardia duodenalis]|uniref:Reverse transcriptase domain-containing protein n=1 Tax=Giardia intestinalis TaxID=5741 RepID=V6T8E6_GIAIN|nr:Hypothetical protein DHA2_154256 [Giardia intestinalis]